MSERWVLLRATLDISFSPNVHVHACAKHLQHKQMCTHTCVQRMEESYSHCCLEVLQGSCLGDDGSRLHKKFEPREFVLCPPILVNLSGVCDQTPPFISFLNVGTIVWRLCLKLQLERK